MSNIYSGQNDVALREMFSASLHNSTGIRDLVLQVDGTIQAAAAKCDDPDGAADYILGECILKAENLNISVYTLGASHPADPLLHCLRAQVPRSKANFLRSPAPARIKAAGRGRKLAAAFEQEHGVPASYADLAEVDGYAAECFYEERGPVYGDAALAVAESRSAAWSWPALADVHLNATHCGAAAEIIDAALRAG